MPEFINDGLAWINLVVLIAGLAFSWIRFSQKLGEIRGEFRNGLESVQAMMSSYGVLISSLSEKEILPTPDIHEVSKPFLKLGSDSIEKLLGRLKPSGNPVSQNEIDRLKQYVHRAQQGDEFNPAEAQEFYEIAKKIESEPEYKSDVGTLFLVGLAGFIAGLAIGSLSKN